MPERSNEVLVLRSEAGELFTVPVEAIEPFRVPSQYQQEIEDLAAGDEVSGFQLGVSPRPGFQSVGTLQINSGFSTGLNYLPDEVVKNGAAVFTPPR